MEHNDDLIQYKIQRCDESIKDAENDIKTDSFHSAENRMYYAIFYIVSALAKQNEFYTSNHGQLMGWFNKNFILTEKIDSSLGRIYKSAFEKRQKGDYDDFVTFTKEEVEEDFKNMIKFIDSIKNLL